MKYYIFILFYFIFTLSIYCQKDDAKNDSIKKATFLNYLGKGYLPTKYFDFDLRYLIKYNQYEGFRTGLGGITNTNFSKKYRVNLYTVYGFLDHTFKYGFGLGIRAIKNKNSWLTISYTDDLQETGSSNFLTDKRFFQFFEPRLLNIDLFHNYVARSVGFEHEFSSKIQVETQFSVSDISPTYDYIFNPNNTTLYSNFNLSTLKTAVQWSPFNSYKTTKNNTVVTKERYPKLTLQYTSSIANMFKSDFNFSKLDARIIHQINYKNEAQTEFVLTGGLAEGDIPLTHLYHAYPNNINKEKILRRFSIAGVNSFETMYFNEFFSDKFITLQMKHKLKPFNISPWFKPQLILISRYAYGRMNNIERHENINFNTLEKGFYESGFEINKLILGFGLSFAYRYGPYHLPNFDDNISFKFTFYINL